MHEVKDPSGTNTLRHYTYTPEGLLDEATYNSRTLTNTWDGDKNRVSFTAASTTHTFVYDTTAGIPAVIQEDGVYYVREPDGSLIARVSGTNTSYYHFDTLGSTRLLTDGSGTVTDKYAYDAYGSLIAHDELTGSVDQPYQYVGELGYYTHYQEPEFGLMQLGVRFYDSEVGRFTSRDQLALDFVADTIYANASPLSRVDPSGYKCHKVNPSQSSNYVGSCISQLKNCLPGGGGPALRSALGKSEFLVCDGTNGNANGDTYCSRGKCTIRIWPKNQSTDCGSLLHEMMHAYWWPQKRNSIWGNIMGEDSREHSALNDAAHNAWEYYCGRLKGNCPSNTDKASILYHLGIPYIGLPE